MVKIELGDINLRKSEYAHMRYRIPTMVFLTEWLEMVPQDKIEEYDRKLWLTDMIEVFDKTNEAACKLISDTGFAHISGKEKEDAIFEYKAKKILSKAKDINTRMEDNEKPPLKLPKSSGRTTASFTEVEELLKKYGL